MAVGRRACPSRQLRRRSTSWYSSVSDSMSSAQAPSRLKQIDGRSCTGNVNLLKLGWPTSPSAEPRRSARLRAFAQSLVITRAANLPEGIRGNEPSDPRAHAPLPAAFVRPAVSVKPLGSRERYTCYLQGSIPLLPLHRDASPTPKTDASPTPKTFGQGETYGGSG